MWLEFIIAPVMSIYDSRCFDLAHRNIRHLLARIVHTLNPSKPLEPRDIYLTAVSCRSIIAFGMTLLFQTFYELVALLSPPTFSSMVFSWVACSIKSRSMLSLALTNDVVGLNLLILYHLLGYVTFVSHYIDDVTARICCECRTMSNVREKSSHMICTLFSNVAFISNRIDDITAKHAVTCCDLSRYVLEKSLITLSNKPSTLMKLQTSHFCYIKLIDDVIARRVE